MDTFNQVKFYLRYQKSKGISVQQIQNEQHKKDNTLHAQITIYGKGIEI